MADAQLTKEEWEAAMGFVVAAAADNDADDKPVFVKGKKPIFVKKGPKGSKVKAVPTKDGLVLEIPSGGGWARRVGKPEPKNTDLNEIPNNHPAGTKSPITPADPQKNDTDDNSNIQDEIPAGGGFATRVGKPTPKNTDLNEIPNNHPPASGPRTPADWAALAKAAKDALNYGTDTSAGWGAGKPLPKANEAWGDNFPPGARAGYGATPPDGKTTTSTENKAVRTSLASDDEVTDLSRDGSSLPDGSFCIHTADDLKVAISKVENADQNNPHQGFHPWYSDIKRHIAKRADALDAQHLIPADWQMMLAALEDNSAEKFE